MFRKLIAAKTVLFLLQNFAFAQVPLVRSIPTEQPFRMPAQVFQHPTPAHAIAGLPGVAAHLKSVGEQWQVMGQIAKHESDERQGLQHKANKSGQMECQKYDITLHHTVDRVPFKVDFRMNEGKGPFLKAVDSSHKHLLPTPQLEKYFRENMTTRTFEYCAVPNLALGHSFTLPNLSDLPSLQSPTFGGTNGGREYSLIGDQLRKMEAQNHNWQNSMESRYPWLKN